MQKNIFLIGFMGTGKSTVSRQLGRRLKFLEIDMDQEIETRQGKKISEIFKTEGEEYFRSLETGMIRELAQRTGYVISCGGGAVLRAENVESMKESGIVVLLLAEPETVYERVRNRRNRPLLNGNMNVEYIAGLMAKRETAYRSAADISVVTDHRTPEDIAEEIVRQVSRRTESKRKNR